MVRERLTAEHRAVLGPDAVEHVTAPQQLGAAERDTAQEVRREHRDA